MTNLERMMKSNPELTVKLVVEGWEAIMDCEKDCPLFGECKGVAGADNFQCGEFVREWLLREETQ